MTHGGSIVIVACPECTGHVSDKASVCPHCGYPLQAGSAREASVVVTAAGPGAVGALQERKHPSFLIQLWRILQVIVGLGALALWTLGAWTIGSPDAASPGLAMELRVRSVMYLLAITAGIGTLRIWKRKRGAQLNEWLGLPWVLGIALAGLMTVEAVAGFASTQLASYHFGGLIIPGVSAVWAFYGISEIQSNPRP